MKKKEKRNQKNLLSPEIILSPTDEKMVSLKEHKRVCYNLCILLMIILVLSLIACSTFLTINYTNLTNEKVNDYFSMKYDTVYYPETKDDVEDIISTASSISDPYQKLETIGEWVCEDFIDYVELNTELNPYPRQNIGTYVYNSEGRVRATAGEYHGDPYWIAYHRFGGCGELGYLFAHVARESGLETRIVRADYADKLNNHVWLEIKINDEWMYVDPTMYWCSEYYQKSYEWIMPMSEWWVWNEPLIGVWDSETGEEVTHHYPLATEASEWKKFVVNTCRTVIRNLFS